MKHLSVGTRWNADLVASYHERWTQDPLSVDAEWRTFFEGFELGLSLPPKPGKSAPGPAGSVDAVAQFKVLAAIEPIGCSATSKPASTPCSTLSPTSP